MGLAAAFLGLSVTALAYSLLALLFSEERQVRRRLRDLSEYEAHQLKEGEPLAAPFSRRVLSPMAAGLAGLLRSLAPRDYRSRLTGRLKTAGSPVDPDGFLVMKLVSMVAGAGSGLLFGSVFAGSAIGTAIIGIAAAVLGSFLPDLWLKSRTEARQGKMRRELPDMLDMLMISVEAGLGFDAAVTKYVQNRRGPLAEEFSIMLHEIQAGLSRRDALRHVAKRTKLDAVNAFVMAMVQADVFGVSVGNVLRTQSKEMRLKRRQYAEEVAQKAPAKMVFPLVLCILPATMIVVLGPAVIAIAEAFGAM